VFFPNLLQVPVFHTVREVCYKCVCTVCWYPCVVLGMAGMLAQKEEKHSYAEIMF